MESDVGIACGACDAWCPLGTSVCIACGYDVSYLGQTAPPGVESSRSVLSETGFLAGPPQPAGPESTAGASVRPVIMAGAPQRLDAVAVTAGPARRPA